MHTFLSFGECRIISNYQLISSDSFAPVTKTKKGESSINQKESMQHGIPYFPNDRQLTRDRTAVQKWLRRYNRLLPAQRAKRYALLKKIIPNIGVFCSIYPPFFCDYGYNIYVGDNFFANVGCIMLDAAEIRIGNNVMVGPHTIIAAVNHPMDSNTRNTGQICGKPILISDEVWIGAGCVINPGVKIGGKTIIGSGSVVVHDIPANVIAAGNPCRIIREIT